MLRAAHFISDVVLLDNLMNSNFHSYTRYGGYVSFSFPFEVIPKKEIQKKGKGGLNINLVVIPCIFKEQFKIQDL